MSFQQLRLNINQYNFGGLAVGLYLISLLGLGWIAFQYSLFPLYTIPILLTVVFGVAGITLAFASGGLNVSVRPIRLTALAWVIMSVFMILTLTFVANLITPELQTSFLLNMPTIVALAFFGFIGIQEEAFWRGIYVFLRRFSPGVKGFILNSGVQAFGGMAYHQAVGRQLFGGTVFSSPEFYIWVGLSWILYVVLLEITKNFGVSMGGHFIWNVMVTGLNMGVI